MHLKEYIAFCSLALVVATGCADAPARLSNTPVPMQTPTLRAPTTPTYTLPVPTTETLTEFSGYVDCSHVRREERQRVIRENIERIIKEDRNDQGHDIYSRANC